MGWFHNHRKNYKERNEKMSISSAWGGVGVNTWIVLSPAWKPSNEVSAVMERSKLKENRNRGKQ